MLRMRRNFLRSFLASFLIIAGAGAVDQPKYIPGAYLVEFADDQNDQTFTTHLRSQQLLASPRITIASEVFNGASYQFDTKSLGEDPIHALKQIQAVKNVWPIEMIKRPTDELIWKGNDPSSIPAQIKEQIASNETGFSPHVMTQVDKLHAEGITGKGIKIGIVDDGVDYKHPALGGCFGEGCLIARGYDHIGDNFTSFGSSEPQPTPDPDPYTNCEGHGTHVSGIVAAQQNQYGFTGASPGVELGMYRVFACSGETTLDIVAQGITKAYEDGNHIITASLGKQTGWPEDPLSVIAQRIIEKGVICTFAQGNSGFAGPFSAEAPATAKDAVAVASISNTEVPRVFLNATYTVDNGTSRPFGWTYGQPDAWGNVSLPLVIGDAHLGNLTNVCDEFPNAGNLSGYVVLIQSVTQCSDWFKSSFAAKKGVTHALFYVTSTEATELIQFPADDMGPRYPLPKAVGMVPAATAQEFINNHKSGKQVTLQVTDPKFAKQYVSSVKDPAGGYLSDFTSWGPSWELDSKPDIAAPGGNILSTFPINLGGYAVISGTSMSTPLAAGIFALIMEARGKVTTSEIRNMLSSTSKQLTTLNGTNPLPDLPPIHQQGSGIAQAWSAAHASGVLSTRSKEVTYALGHQPAFTLYTLNAGGKSVALAGELLYTRSYAKVSFGEPSVTVQTGSEVTIAVSFAAPDGLDTTRLPVYSGYITLDGSNGEKLSLPYLGVAGSMRKTAALTKFYLSRSDSSPSNPAAPSTEFIFHKNPNSTDPIGNVTERFVSPFINCVLTLSTTVFDIQLHSLAVSNSSANETAPIGENLGSLPGYPTNYVPRTSQWLEYWEGELKNGSRVAPGKYTFVGRTLRIFGEAEKEEDWDVLRSIDFSIRYA